MKTMLGKATGVAAVMTAFVAVGGALALGCGAPDGTAGSEATGSEGSAVEHTYRMLNHFDYVFTPDEGSKATGALFVPARNRADDSQLTRNGIPVRYTCGVTFISPHYAITAAHCVDQVDIPDPPSRALTVESYDISAVSWDKLRAAQTIDSLTTYPNYGHTTLTEADGYKVTRYAQCHVVRRCGTSYGKYACDAEADVALIKCDDRGFFSPYLAVANADDLTGNVSMNWYHEVYDVPTQPPIPPSPSAPPISWFVYGQAQDKFDHYVNYANGPAENYHYLANNQLMPLKSTPWRYGDIWVDRRRLWADGTVVWTDMFGCHGTSGSGVTQTNAAGHLELLGPVAAAGEHWDSRLCEDAEAATRGRPGLGYTQLAYTRMLAQTAFDDPGEWFKIRWPLPRL